MPASLLADPVNGMTLAPGDLILKDPDSTIPLGFDWTSWLAEFAGTETIATSTWTITGSDSVLTSSSPSIVTGSLKTQAKFAAGTLGVRYTVTNRVVTTPSSYTDDRSINVLIQQE